MTRLQNEGKRTHCPLGLGEAVPALSRIARNILSLFLHFCFRRSFESLYVLDDSQTNKAERPKNLDDTTARGCGWRSCHRCSRATRRLAHCCTSKTAPIAIRHARTELIWPAQSLARCDRRFNTHPRYTEAAERASFIIVCIFKLGLR